jgi:O-acetyl-ADP-ribose deacetylase (regulator of RNase III)
MIKLEKCQGNILDFKTDFIVNASNTTLSLGSGVSMVLKKACGNELQSELLKIRQGIYNEDRLIEPGEVFATSSFNHQNSQYVLHAAVINYNPGCGVGGLNPQRVETVFEEFVEKYKQKTDATIYLVKYS